MAKMFNNCACFHVFMNTADRVFCGEIVELEVFNYYTNVKEDCHSVNILLTSYRAF